MERLGSKVWRVSGGPQGLGFQKDKPGNSWGSLAVKLATTSDSEKIINLEDNLIILTATLLELDYIATILSSWTVLRGSLGYQCRCFPGGVHCLGPREARANIGWGS